MWVCASQWIPEQQATSQLEVVASLADPADSIDGTKPIFTKGLLSLCNRWRQLINSIDPNRFDWLTRLTSPRDSNRPTKIDLFDLRTGNWPISPTDSTNPTDYTDPTKLFDLINGLDQTLPCGSQTQSDRRNYLLKLHLSEKSEALLKPVASIFDVWEPFALNEGVRILIDHRKL